MGNYNYKQTYWQRLPDHPGHAPALLFAVLAMMTAARNETVSIVNVAVVGLIVLVLCYIPILITNRN